MFSQGERLWHRDWISRANFRENPEHSWEQNPKLMLHFKYGTRIPLIHDASVMVFPLLERCVQLWLGPTSLSLFLSQKRQRERGRKVPEKHNQNSLRCAEDLHTRQGRGAGDHRGLRGALCLGEQQADQQSGSAGLGVSQPRGTRDQCQGIWAQPGSVSVFFVTWNEPFNTLGLVDWCGGNFGRVF